jgi:PIN domain nuclease of toxin-antitoxin system
MFLNNTQNKNQSNQSSNNQKTVQKSTQKVVQDQHCSNGIFFSLLSVFETIVLFHKKLLSADRQKQFGKYDAYSYDKKNLPQLHSQAHGMVIAFRATKKVFR